MKKFFITSLLLFVFLMLSACKDVVTVETAVIDLKHNTSFEMTMSDYVDGTIEYAKIIRQGDLYQFTVQDEGLVLQENSDLTTFYIYDEFYDLFLERRSSRDLITPFDHIISLYFSDVKMTWFNREGEILTIREDRRFSIPNSSPYKNATEASIMLEKHVLKVSLNYENGRETRINVKLKNATQITKPETTYELQNNAHFIYFIKDYKVHILALNTLNPENIITIPQMIQERLVVSIGQEAFRHFRGTSIVFAEDSFLEFIGPYAFRDITLTTNLVLPNTVKTIHEKAFFNATIPNIHFGSSLEMIENEAFAYASISKLFFQSETDVNLFDTNWNNQEVPYQIGLE